MANLKTQINQVFEDIPVYALFVPLGLILAAAYELYLAVNSFTTWFLGWGKFNKELKPGHGKEVSDLFASIVRDDLVSGKITVSCRRILDCGCEEPSREEEKLSIHEAREHLRKNVRYIGRRFSNDGADITRYSFKVKGGECTITYPAVHYDHLDAEGDHTGFISLKPVFPRTSYEFNGLMVYFRGKRVIFEKLIENGREERQAALLGCPAKASQVASS